jgi:hypothetical protein
VGRHRGGPAPRQHRRRRAAKGLHLLRSAGLDPRADPAILLIALYLALVAADSELLQDAGERAHAWALGLPEDSPLVAVVDVLLVAAGRGPDPDTVLRHLYGVPAFTRPVPGGDRRFTSDPGGAPVALELGYRQVDTRDSKILRMDADGAAMLRAQTAAFEAKSGRPPAPDEPIFFDPTPTPPNRCRRRGWRPSINLCHVQPPFSTGTALITRAALPSLHKDLSIRRSARPPPPALHRNRERRAGHPQSGNRTVDPGFSVTVSSRHVISIG